MPKDSKIVVKGVNVRKKHIKPRKQGEEGGIIPVECAVNSSIVNVVCPKCGKATRVGYKIEDDKKVRVCLLIISSYRTSGANDNIFI